ncbi:PAS domain S-box protein [Mucilaginibacter sp. X4EP1]|uniref:PAS domain-containing sensor histidine kinase n=1 Tax=Mucilaginibacter sp. X4EP1 TaxID=2723092 RepID=UPI002168E75E|nr:PAS domain-containing sensor histidine kinase [Mucilaginibacter sp. X4EP1]MCS3812893.1 PAS domain S-box-containing protein [Mucilaginibacter sp. X4EP1]
MLFRSSEENNINKVEDAHPELIAFFNAMDEVFFSVDMTNSTLIQISDACENLYGYKPIDFLINNKLWFELIHPDDKHLASNEDEILRRGEPVNNAYRIIHKNGSVRWVEKKIIPGLNESGTLVRVDGITRDITLRKQNEEAQLETDARYRQIVENAQEGIWTIDVNNKTNFVNQKMADLLGYTPAEMIGKELFDFVDAEEKEFLIACMERRRKGAQENLNIRYKRKNGDDFWANISANPILDDEGQYKGALAMVIDITQRMASEEALKISEANLRTIFENTDTAYILFDLELKIVSFNALAQKYSESHNNQTLEVNKAIQDYFTPERWLFITETLKKVAAGEMINYELSYTKSDGFVQWHNVRWLNVKNNEGKNWGFILANKDITEAKSAALERERITADLIQHNNDLEQFTYIISHNLRAPVANIMGLADMLKEHDFDQEVRSEIVERVSRSISNIDVIIQDLNSILQARGAVNEKKETIYFDDVINSIKTSIYNTLVTKNVQFKCSFTEIESIFSIRSYIYSIFYNLSLNSVKYYRTDVPPVITIRSKLVDGEMEICFTDNGKGIDLEKNGEHLFGLYKRFDTTTEGKGMGLFMVKTQVEALGGSIKVKSKLNEGTEFTIRFKPRLVLPGV